MSSSLKQHKVSMEEREKQKTKTQRKQKKTDGRNQDYTKAATKDIQGLKLTSAKSRQRKFASNISTSSQATYY